jgi:hypothetical protein
MKEREILIIRIDTKLKKQLKKMAEQDGRTMSNYVINLIRKASKENA